MLWTLHPRRPGVQVGHELTTVEVTPHPLFAVVIEREQLAALRAGPLAICGMLSPNVDALLRDVQLDSADSPWLFDAQQMTIQLGVLHAPETPAPAQATHAHPSRTANFKVGIAMSV